MQNQNLKFFFIILFQRGSKHRKEYDVFQKKFNCFELFLNFIYTNATKYCLYFHFRKQTKKDSLPI